MSDGHPNYKGHWEIRIFLAEYTASLNKIGIVLVRKKGKIDIGTLVMSAILVIESPLGGHIFFARTLKGGDLLV